MDNLKDKLSSLLAAFSQKLKEEIAAGVLETKIGPDGVDMDADRETTLKKLVVKHDYKKRLEAMEKRKHPVDEAIKQGDRVKRKDIEGLGRVTVLDHEPGHHKVSWEGGAHSIVNKKFLRKVKEGYVEEDGRPVYKADKDSAYDEYHPTVDVNCNKGKEYTEPKMNLGEAGDSWHTMQAKLRTKDWRIALKAKHEPTRAAHYAKLKVHNKLSQEEVSVDEAAKGTPIHPIGTKVKINRPEHWAHGKTGVVQDNRQGSAGHHIVSIPGEHDISIRGHQLEPLKESYGSRQKSLVENDHKMAVIRKANTKKNKEAIKKKTPNGLTKTQLASRAEKDVKQHNKNIGESWQDKQKELKNVKSRFAFPDKAKGHEELARDMAKAGTLKGIKDKLKQESTLAEALIMGHKKVHNVGDKIKINHPNSESHGKRGIVTGHHVERAITKPEHSILWHHVKIDGHKYGHEDNHHEFTGERLKAE